MTQTTMTPATISPALATSVTPVKTNNVPPFNGAGMTTAQIMTILHRLDPGAVAEAGAAHTNLGDVLDTMAAALTRHAQTLAQNWTGTAARTAMTRFQQLHDQTTALAAQAAQTGSVLTWLGTQVLPKFQQLQTPSTGSAVAADAAVGGIAGAVVAGPIGAVAGTAVGGLDALLTGAGDAAAQAQAQKYLSALSGYLVTANAALPDQIGGVTQHTAAGAAGAQAGNGTNTAGTGAGGTGTTGAAGTGGAGVAGRSTPGPPEATAWPAWPAPDRCWAQARARPQPRAPAGRVPVPVRPVPGPPRPAAPDAGSGGDAGRAGQPARRCGR